MMFKIDSEREIIEKDYWQLPLSSFLTKTLRINSIIRINKKLLTTSRVYNDNFEMQSTEISTKVLSFSTLV